MEDYLQLKKSASQDAFDNVTLLFADIAGFTKYSSSVEPETVVNLLKTLFTGIPHPHLPLSIQQLVWCFPRGILPHSLALLPEFSKIRRGERERERI